MANGNVHNLVALIVEDEALIALEIEDLLAADGFTCLHAADRADLEAMFLDDIAIAIVDLRLRGNLEGPDIIRLLRRRISNLPVVVVTGHDMRTPDADLRGLGGPTIRLHKPVPPEDLRNAARVVTRRRYSRAVARYGRRQDDGPEAVVC